MGKDKAVKDYYAVLGLPPTASGKEIKEAFRKLAREYHPDNNQGNKVAEAKFKEANDAHYHLGDRERRKKYDQERQGSRDANGRRLLP